ncbi:hypothetical protein JCM8547_003087 [Rhodosporidiobolus lusitaniae]
MTAMDLDGGTERQDSPAAPSPPRAPTLISPLELDLAHRTSKLLERLGVLSTTTSTSEQPATVINPLAHSTQHWIPLVPLADLTLLLSAIPPSQLPSNLPFVVQSAAPSPATRLQILDTLARLALEPSLTVEVISLFRPLAAALVGRWVDLLGFSDEGRWREGEVGVEQAPGEKDAVEKVWRAIVRVLPLLGDEVMPYFRLILRHPLLVSGPPIADPNSPTFLLSLLCLHSAIHHLPSLPAIAGWSLPTSVEQIMKTHPHRGTRLVAWRMVRAWLGLYAGTGEELKRQWVWQLPTASTSSEVQPLAPVVPYEQEYVDEYASIFGADAAALGDVEDALPVGFGEEVISAAGTSRLVEGGLEVLVSKLGVDPWVLPLLESVRANEVRQRVLPLSIEVDGDASSWLGSLTPPELGKTVVVVSSALAFREGLIPSVSTTNALSTTPTPVASVSQTNGVAPSSTGPQPEIFVPTPAHSALLTQLADNVRCRIPTLITGSPSSGKQSAITHLWNLVHSSPSSPSTPTKEAKRRGLVTINLADRSLDSKSLLGSLSSAPSSSSTSSSTAGAGSFTFVEGPLTRAIRQGRWLLLLNVDQAAPELMSVVKVAAERMFTSASQAEAGRAYGGIGAEEADGGVGIRVGGGEGRWVKAAEGFMLFATRSVPLSSLRTAGGADAAPSQAAFFASHYFRDVVLAPLASEEVGLIVKGRYGPQLDRVSGLAELLVESWERVRELAAAVKAGGQGGTKRDVGVRDLLRWCRRVAHLLPPTLSLPSLASNPTLQEEVFVEARDVFLGSMVVPPLTSVAPSIAPTTEEAALALTPSLPRDRFSVLARSLATTLGLSTDRAEWCLRRRVPELVLPTIDTSSGVVPAPSTSSNLSVKVGRVALPYLAESKRTSTSRPYALTKPSIIVLEKLAVCLSLSEPVLLVGETGTGKTAAVGYLAELMGKRLTALNLSNQTEAGDLVGGFRPIDEAEEARRTASELVNRFVELFGATFNLSKNGEFVSHVRKAFDKKRYARLVGLWREAAKMASSRVTSTATPAGKDEQAQRKRRKVDSAKAILAERWKDFTTVVGDFEHRHVHAAGKGKAKFVFSFVEGPLAQAIRNGDWVLLDEVNLASSETLESLSTLLQAPDSSLVLTEQGDLEPVPRHPEFRLFACMNPATDVGKRDLPAGLRAKFSEIWVPPPDEDRDALRTIVEGYIGRVAVSDRKVVDDVAELYAAVKNLALRAQLADGQNMPPHFSMRTLARALSFAAEFAATFGLRRALYEGFVMAFTMLLDDRSQTVVRALIDKHVVQPAKNPKSLMERVPTMPPSFTKAMRIHHYWLEEGPHEPEEPNDYILTPSVQAKVCDLARAVLTRKVPVLIQGPTSAGKTSVVEYLAKRTGHRFVRINNHEHTDIQEYVGTYVSDPQSGKLVFQEGVLVRALRNGDWIVLDELNLAPTDVLEALNRLLDDNRELVIPETGEVVRPHPHFMLFATQNPPGLYGGRKVLSRAFRNRFLEMHFGDVPKDELKTILERRCRIAPSHAERTVNVFLELQRRRQAGRVFEQKQAFATLRDLFRWGGRGPVESIQQLAEDGYMLLAERTRRADDKKVVKEVLEEVLKVKLDEAHLYDFERLPQLGLPVPSTSGELVWTSAMRRLYFLIAASLQRNEPVLLVGETGAGKTSVCQALALALSSLLHIVGCHQNTETADLLGGQRPLRNRAALQSALRTEAVELLQRAERPAPANVEGDFEEVFSLLEAFATATKDDTAKALTDRMRATTALFEWHDGPLVQAMRGGDLILLDEISLADDSVLERLNSVLEPARTLVLAEKGGHDLDDIRVVGQTGFQILATMNPGGDFGKKELSPALRNRFTEIWVPAVDDLQDLLFIIGSRWDKEHREHLEPFGTKMLDFAQWLGGQIGQGDGLGIGLRDILGWVDFLNAAARQGRENLADSFCQGALMTVVDGLGALPATSGLSKDGLDKLKASCWRFLEQLVPATMAPESLPLDVSDSNGVFSVGPFGVKKGDLPPAKVDYTLLAPTTRLNAMRLLRALQLKKPVLLEGSPGVGKTSLVTALSAATGHPLVRINLSDQTDLMDLLGSDLPVEGGKSGEFAWKDAPFLAAMQKGEWVLLDEMNLASQSVLEGLNSCLDHRGAVYIPELDRTFSRHRDFRIFAAQNPLGQGGGRKGLPKSFLDRFSLVHMEELNSFDLNAIAAALYPDIDAAVLGKMIAFNSTVHRQTMEARAFGMEGSPWEFNLRDVLRWLALLKSSSGLDIRRNEAVEYIRLLYLQRFRNFNDREHVARLFADSFGETVNPVERPWPSVTVEHAQIGHSLLPRGDSSLSSDRATTSLPRQQQSLQPLEALIKCLDMGWLAILTGPHGTGKTSLVRQVAALGGCRLREFTMNAEVDTLELLGSFEQADRFRPLDALAKEAIEILQEAAAAQLKSAATSDVYAALDRLHQLRLHLSAEAADLEVSVVGDLIRQALSGLPSGTRLDEFSSKIDEVVSTTDAASGAARFEWVDGPLVQAMKNGDWLLIEDANTCSPSVLDRLNSLFETGGRLQLAERGPVNGEIQIIAPHPAFRLVMTLDPRNGELSRAMRNRGIEIALLPSPFSLPQAAAPSLLDVDQFREPTFAPIVRLAQLAQYAVPAFSSTTLVQQLASTVSPTHYPLVLRVLRTFSFVEPTSAEFVVRQLSQHALVQHSVATKKGLSESREVPFNLLAVQPVDSSLVPLEVALESPLANAISSLLESLAFLLVSPSSRPQGLRRSAAKPARLLAVWDKSLLTSHGKFKLDEADLTIAGLFPLYSALGDLIVKLAGVRFDQLNEQDRQALAQTTRSLQALATELEAVTDSAELDFSTVQHVVAWIDSALQQLPPTLTGLADEALERLAPLRTSLTLTSGKAMEQIWKASLPFKPATPVLAEAYERLLARGQESAGEAWEKAISSLFLEISIALGVPQDKNQLQHAGDVAQVVEQLLQRIPAPAQHEHDDPVIELADASNAASLLVSELATVSTVLAGRPSALSAGIFIKIVQGSGAIPLSEAVAVHQLASWPSSSSDSKPAALFATLLNWSSHLARGFVKVPSAASAVDIARPLLLRKVLNLRSGETPTLGNLVTQSSALARTASLQLTATASSSTSRAEGLRAVLVALIGLVVSSVEEKKDETSAISHTTLVDFVSARTTASAVLDESSQRYLVPSLPPLQQPAAALSAVAGGFVAFARFLWHLYVPNLPIDPAVGLRAHSSFLGRQLSAISELLAAVKLDELAITGNEKNVKLERVQQEVDVLRRQLEQAGVAPVSREGNPALLSALFAELRSFQEQIVGDNQLNSLVKELQKPWSTSAENRESNLQRSIDTLLRRLDHAYAETSDILSPIRLSLATLKIGFALLAHISRAAAAPSSQDAFRTLLHRLVAFPAVAYLPLVHQDELALTLKVGETPLHPAQATLLQVAALTSNIVDETTTTAEAAVRLTQLYERLHYLWATDRRHDEEAAEEAASLYKAKVDSHQVATDEELEAAEFAKLFPAFEDAADKEDGTTSATPAVTGSGKPRLVQPADQHLLAKLHVGLFGKDSHGFATTSTNTLNRLRQSGVRTLLPQLYESLDDALDRDSAVYRVRTLVELSQAVNPPEQVEAPHHDFYNEANVRETAKAVPVLLAFIERLVFLAEKWPDQVVLHSLRERCETILALTADASIALVLTNLEQLLQQSEDWEKFADREHSISTNRDALIALIVEWRRFELKCWSRLLSTVETKFEQSVADWWFRFYETAIRGAPGVDRETETTDEEAETFYRDLVALLDSFFKSCSIGQYAARLDLVLSFANYASKLSSRADAVQELGNGAASLKRVSDVLYNVHAFYSQFVGRITTTLTAERARVEKEVQNVIKLASWKDINVFALRASAVRSHHQLYKCVRKLRTLLQKPASDFFSVETDKVVSTTISAALPPLAVTTVDLPALPANLVNENDAPYLVKLDQTLSRLNKLAASSVGELVGAGHGAGLEDFSVQIISTAKELREEPLGPEEGREQRVKNLIERKRRAWRDLLNELKRLGISPSPSPKIVDRLEDAGALYSLGPAFPLLSLDEVVLGGDARQRLIKADSYHYRLISELPTLRTYPANHNADVRTPDIQRALGHIQSGVNLTIEQRTQLITASQGQLRLDLLVKRFENAVLQQPASSIRQLCEALLRATSKGVLALGEARDELVNFRVAAQDAIGLEATLAGNLVNDALATAGRDQDRLRDVLNSLGGFDPLLSTPEELALANEVREHLVSTIQSFATFTSPASLRYIVKPLTAFLESLELPVVTKTSSATDISSLKAGHDELIGAVLIVAQELKRLADEGVKVVDEDELVDQAVGVAGRSYRAISKALRLEEMIAKVEGFARQAHQSLNSNSAASTLVSRVAPFLRLYSDLLSRHLSSSFDWHKSSLKLNHVLSSILKELATEGFCRPPEGDSKNGADDASDGKTTEGTGMAEGTGAKNVSNEIEDESQLEGLQSDVPQDKKEDEQEEEGDDDAVEMQGDFEGEMQDRGDGEKEEKEDGESEDEEEQEEPEEQVGDVDPLDPSSVDEKFWGDDEPPSESKDGKTDEVNQETQQQSGEAEMSAKEDQLTAPEPKGEEGADGKKEEQKAGQEEDANMEKKEGEEQDGETGDEEGGEGVEDDQEGADGEEQEPATDQKGEQLDGQMPEADNLDLPEDMNLDGDDKDQDEGDGDDLDLDDEMNDLPEGEEGEGENDERPDQLDEMGEAKEDGDEEDGEHPLTADDTSAQPEGEEDKKLDETLDQSLGGADQGETGGEGEQDSTAAKPAASSADVSRQAGAQSAAEESTEADAQREAGAEDADADADMEQDDQDAPAPSAPSASGTGPSKQRAAADPSADPNAQPDTQQDRSPAEQQRSLGDALQNWRRRLEAIGDLAQPEQEENKPEGAAPDAQQDGAVEYVQEGDEQDVDEQALGPANEEQVKKFEQLHLGEEVAPPDDFPQDYDMAADEQDAPATQQQQAQTMQLKGSTLAESDAKAIPATELREERTRAEEDRDMEDEQRAGDDDQHPSTTFAPPIDPQEDKAVEQAMLKWRSGDDPTMNSEGVWRLYESLTRDLSFALTEQLRLILEPTLATRLKGDYRSGKRLNMKKIIPYIASEFTKDKIWLRRTRPSQREYQVLIAIDDSKSMADSHSVHLAFQSLALISRALTRLEVGGVSICRFGEQMDVLHPFEAGVVSDEAGATLLSKFTFQQTTTDVRLLVERSLAHLAAAKESASSGKSSMSAGDLWQLQVIISDGMCQDHDRLRALLRKAAEQKVMFVFVVIDSLHRRAEDPQASAAVNKANEANQHSILAMKSVSYVTNAATGRLELKMDRYLDSFPFEYFVVLRDVEALPEVLSATLRQFFERVSSDR